MNRHIVRLVMRAAPVLVLILASPSAVTAQALPGGTLDPLTIPKYVIPLVIPPVMNTDANGADSYDIAVRQFKQQILPGGIWNTLNGRTDAFPATPIWSYGPAADPVPAIAPDPGSQFNYPSYTIESISNVPVSVRWRNELVAIDPATGLPCDGIACQPTSLPHLLAVDQTLHWANPPATNCLDGTNRTDCATDNPNPYLGPVPIVTHVHGAHVEPHSDGYPEAWWLPAASNIPAGYATSGSIFDDSTGTNPGNLGYADYLYRNDQPATTLWYHDHSLGMTRSNVYAGPAGFWLVRGGAYDGATDGKTGLPAVLPGPAPVAGEAVLDLNIPGNPVRNKIREIPIAIQDRSFNADGSLFYPDNRAFFEGVTKEQLQIPFVPGSDISPIWNPEAFFNTIVVNGVTWPTLEVAPARYRFRLLNGCNSRFLNLSMTWEKVKIKHGQVKTKIKKLPFYQIGAEQGFLPQVVKIKPGEAEIDSPGSPEIEIEFPTKQQSLLIGLAERADVIVDFSKLPHGTVVTLINTAPDGPFGGFPAIPADPGTTGQVMQFVVNATPAVLGGPLGASPTDPVLADGVTSNPNAATKPKNLILNAEPRLGAPSVTRQVSLNEEESQEVCVTVDPAGNIVDLGVAPGPNFLADCTAAGGVPFAPKAALLGTVDLTDPALPLGIPLKWTDDTGASTPAEITMADGSIRTVNVTENPILGATEDWEIYNFTIDAHPIHLHLVRFEVVDRLPIPGVLPAPAPSGVQLWEMGFKDTVIAYPGEITTIRSRFDIAGLYVWHCHIVEHEDNEMMRPYVVSR